VGANGWGEKEGRKWKIENRKKDLTQRALRKSTEGTEKKKN
jgi:hypothetical protein